MTGANWFLLARLCKKLSTKKPFGVSVKNNKAPNTQPLTFSLQKQKALKRLTVNGLPIQGVRETCSKIESRNTSRADTKIDVIAWCFTTSKSSKSEILH